MFGADTAGTAGAEHTRASRGWAGNGGSSSAATHGWDVVGPGCAASASGCFCCCWRFCSASHCIIDETSRPTVEVLIRQATEQVPHAAQLRLQKNTFSWQEALRRNPRRAQQTERTDLPAHLLEEKTEPHLPTPSCTWMKTSSKVMAHAEQPMRPLMSGIVSYILSTLRKWSATKTPAKTAMADSTGRPSAQGRLQKVRCQCEQTPSTRTTRTRVGVCSNKPTATKQSSTRSRCLRTAAITQFCARMHEAVLPTHDAGVSC